MAYFLTSIAHSTTGVKTVNCGFQPIGMRLTIGQKFGTAQTFAHRSVGMSDGTSQTVTTIFQDTTGGKTVTDDTKLISHWERVSGTLTEVLAANFDSFTATAGKYNVTIANVNYNIYVELWS